MVYDTMTGGGRGEVTTPALLFLNVIREHTLPTLPRAQRDDTPLHLQP